MKKDLFALVKVPIKSIDTVAQTDGTVNGASADLKGQRSCLIIDVDARTDGIHTPSLEESSDDSTFTAVAAADLVGSFTVVDGAADDDQAYIVGYSGPKRYVRVVLVTTGATTGAIIGAMIMPGHKLNGGKLN